MSFDNTFRFPVSNLDCNLPDVSFRNENFTELYHLYNPYPNYKSYSLYLKTDTTLNCAETSANTKQWTISRRDEDTGHFIEWVDISVLPTR